MKEAVSKYENQTKWGWYRLQPVQWKQYLATPRKVRVLEIGAYDGVSANLMLDEIFTHPESEVHTVDPFLSDPTTPGVGSNTRERFEENCRRGGHGGRIQLYEGLSVEVMGWMIAEEGYWEGFDVVFIDGSHLARDVMTDATMGWHLLKPGGMMVFDDYHWGMHLPSIGRPREAIDAFVAAFSAELVPVWTGAQKFILKRGGPEIPGQGPAVRKCAVVGPYASGAGDLVRTLEGWGYRIGRPLWEPYYESAALREMLVKWWAEPDLVRQAGPMEVVAGLRRWLDETGANGAAVCASHPLLAFCLAELEEAWGADTLLIWLDQPLTASISALKKEGWFSEPARIQSQIHAALNDWFGEGKKRHRIDGRSWLENPAGEIERLQEILGSGRTFEA